MKTGTEMAIALFQELAEIHRELVKRKEKNEKQNQKCSSDRIDGNNNGGIERERRIPSLSSGRKRYH